MSLNNALFEPGTEPSVLLLRVLHESRKCWHELTGVLSFDFLPSFSHYGRNMYNTHKQVL